VPAEIQVKRPPEEDEMLAAKRLALPELEVLVEELVELLVDKRPLDDELFDDELFDDELFDEELLEEGKGSLKACWAEITPEQRQTKNRQDLKCAPKRF
jgi:hypothetical protein